MNGDVTQAELLKKYAPHLTPAELEAAKSGKISLTFLDGPKVQAPPLPPGVGPAIAHLRKQMEAQDGLMAQAAVKAATNPVNTTVIDIMKLPPAQQAEELRQLDKMFAASDGFTQPAQAEVVQVKRNSVLDRIDQQPAPAPVPEVTAADAAVSVGHVCKNCRWPQSADPLEVTDLDKQNWLRAVLGTQPFTKKYTLLSGQLEVVLRSRTKRVQGLIDVQIQRELLSGRLVGQDFPMLVNVMQKRLGQLSLAASLVTYTGLEGRILPEMSSEKAMALYQCQRLDGVTEKSEDRPRVDPAAQLADTIVALAYKQLFDDQGPQLEDLLLQQLYVFESLQARLRVLSSAPDFWKETKA